MIQTDYIYLTIPKDWVLTYHKLLVLVADIGVNILDDCSFTCNGLGKSVINTWNIFQAACAAYKLGDNDKATFLKNYVDSQVDLIFKGNNVDVPTKDDIEDIEVSYTPIDSSSADFLVDILYKGKHYTNNIKLEDDNGETGDDEEGTTPPKPNMSKEGYVGFVSTKNINDIDLDNLVYKNNIKGVYNIENPESGNYLCIVTNNNINKVYIGEGALSSVPMKTIGVKEFMNCYISEDAFINDTFDINIT